MENGGKWGRHEVGARREMGWTDRCQGGAEAGSARNVLNRGGDGLGGDGTG